MTKVGVDIDVAIFNGFQSIIKKLLQLYCARHLQQRDEKAVSSDSFQLTTRKRFSGVSSSRQLCTNVVGLFYQNDVESIHAIGKHIQCYKMGSVFEIVSTIKTLVEQKENEEVLALYGGGKCILSQDY